MKIGDLVFLKKGYLKFKNCYVLKKISFFYFKIYILFLKKKKVVSKSKLVLF